MNSGCNWLSGFLTRCLKLSKYDESHGSEVKE